MVLIRNGTGVNAVETELSRSLGLTLKELLPILKRGGDTAEKRFMECCWCLWKVNGSDGCAIHRSRFQYLAQEIPIYPVRANVDNRICGAR